ncbi:hypothetical protein [Bradyrhizobium sp. BR 1432]|uniref:hypothetical protein n=1 Tax=Bradyrhizobium sp. BR 1432 TaxID=3447966 RepID=UPI003EE737F2
MEMSEIARTMSKRMPWPVAQRILSVAELPRRQGWEKTIAALSDQDMDFSEKLDVAAVSLVEHHLCGEKLVRVFKVGSTKADAIRAKVKRLEVPESVFGDVYPLYLDEDALADAPNKPTLVAVERAENGTAVVMASARIVTTREPLDANDLRDGLYDEYEEVYGLKHVRHQAMDVVWIPSSGNVIDIRIDFPQGMHRDVGEAAQAAVRYAFFKLIDFEDSLGVAVNLFPLINAIYRASKEGTVVELAFGTTTASTKHEKMRRKAHCLREEAYHKGGKAALSTPIEPYRLSVHWRRKIGRDKYSVPELSLHSSGRASADSHPELIDAVVRNCMGCDDFDYVKSRMEHFLPKN